VLPVTVAAKLPTWSTVEVAGLATMFTLGGTAGTPRTTADVLTRSPLASTSVTVAV